MDIQTFSKKFINLFEELTRVELSWEDDSSYFYLYNQLDDVVLRALEAQPEALAEIYKSAANNLINKIENYKRDIAQQAELSEDQIIRIILLNRIELLFYQQINQMKNDMAATNFLLADKMVQGALAEGLNGPYHRLYLNELLDYEHLLQAIDFVSKSKPIVDKYGKSVSDKDKMTLSEMSTWQLSKILGKVLEESPKEFLARFPGYRDGFLTKIK